MQSFMGAGLVCDLPKKYDLPLPTSSTFKKYKKIIYLIQSYIRIFNS